MTVMKKIAVVYHSGHGHTEHIARCVARGATRVEDVRVHLLRAEDVAARPEQLAAMDGLVLGSPTYLGGVSGVFQ